MYIRGCLYVDRVVSEEWFIIREFRIYTMAGDTVDIPRCLSDWVLPSWLYYTARLSACTLRPPHAARRPARWSRTATRLRRTATSAAHSPAALSLCHISHPSSQSLFESCKYPRLISTLQTLRSSHTPTPSPSTPSLVPKSGKRKSKCTCLEN